MNKSGVTKSTVIFSSFVIAGTVQHSLLMYVPEGCGGYCIVSVSAYFELRALH